MGRIRLKRAAIEFIAKQAGITNYDPKQDRLRDVGYAQSNIQELYDALEERFGININPRKITTSKTIDEVANYVARQDIAKGILTTRQLPKRKTRTSKFGYKRTQ